MYTGSHSTQEGAASSLQTGEANVDGVGLVDGWMTQGERRDTQGGRFVAAGLREEVVE